MADLSDLQASQSVKIAGAGPASGIESNYLDVDANGFISTKITDGTDTGLVTANGDQKVIDGLRNGGVHGALTLTTGGTAYEAKVGVARLSNRKSLIITAMDNMFWGYDNTVTTSSGTPLFNNQTITFSIDPDSTFQVWLVATANNKTARIAESP